MSPLAPHRPRARGRLLVPVLVAVLVATAVGVTGAGMAGPVVASGGPHIAGGFTFVKTFATQPTQCPSQVGGGHLSNYYTRGDCLRVSFSLTGTDTGTHDIKVQLRSA